MALFPIQYGFISAGVFRRVLDLETSADISPYRTENNICIFSCADTNLEICCRVASVFLKHVVWVYTRTACNIA